MKKITGLLFASIYSIVSSAGIICVSTNITDNAKAGRLSLTSAMSRLDAKAFLALTADKIQELTGKRLITLAQVSRPVAIR